MQKRLTLFFDLDGTLIDVSERSYRIYRDILSEHKKSFLEKPTYWKRKRMHIPIDEILRETKADDSLNEYISKRERLLEYSEYLSHDRVFKNAKNVLRQLWGSHALYLVTLRRNRKMLQHQLEEMKIAKYFETILMPGKIFEPRWKVKKNLFQSYIKDVHTSAFIGDTETDIIAARNTGITSIAICSGIRTKQLLEAAKPNFLIENIGQLIPLLSKI